MEKSAESAPQQTTLQITGMTCSACATRIEKGLSRMEGYPGRMSIWRWSRLQWASIRQLQMWRKWRRRSALWAMIR